MRQRIRLKIELARPSTYRGPTLRNEFTGGTPAVYRNKAFDVEIGFFFNDVLQDISAIATVSLEVKPLDASGNVDTDAASILPEHVLSAVDLNAGLTAGQWANGSAQHGRFRILSSQTGWDMTGLSGNQKNFALIMCAVDTDGERIGLGVTPITMIEDGCGESGNSPEPGDTVYLTAAETMAAIAGLLKQVGLPGETQTLTSQNGRWQRLIYVDNEQGELISTRIGPLN